MHPSNLMAARKEKSRLPTMMDFAILELETNADLELEHGSLGYDFGEDPISKGLQILTNSSLEPASLVIKAIGSPSLVYRYSHSLPLNEGLRGSPIIVRCSGEFFIRGLHCEAESSEGSSEMCLLNKGMFDSLDKFTLRGKIIELSTPSGMQ